MDKILLFNAGSVKSLLHQGAKNPTCLMVKTHTHTHTHVHAHKKIIKKEVIFYQNSIKKNDPY